MATTYRITIQVSSADAVLKLQQMLMKRCRVQSVELVGEDATDLQLPEPALQGRPPNSLRHDTAQRNADIVRKYTEGAGLGALAQEYNVSRERICQILRKENIIEHRRERRMAAKEEIAAETVVIREQARKEFNAMLDRGVELVRQGWSVRQAAMEVGGTTKYHSRFTAVLGAKVKAMGLQSQHGPHRDFTERKRRVRELAAEGLGSTKIVERMRAEGDSIHLNWVYNNMRDLFLKEEPCTNP